MITLRAHGRDVTAVSDEVLTTGSVGIPVRVILSKDFEGLAVTVCFKAGAVEAFEVYEGKNVEVPPQCMVDAGVSLMMGVRGEDADGNVVIPTFLVSVGTIKPGVEVAGACAADPTPSWPAQVQKIAVDAKATAESVRAEADRGVYGGIGNRVTTLDATELVVGTEVTAAGIPAYVSDVSEYAAYGITETGWYVFGRVVAKDGSKVTAETIVEGAAGHIAEVGSGHIDVAVRFEVAAMAQPVTIDWGTYVDRLLFSAPDLAVRNLDYRTSFYVYDISPYVTWEFDPAEGKYTKGYTYFELVDGEYVAIDPTSFDYNAEIPEGVYKHTKVTFEGMVRNVTYQMPDVIDCPLEFKLPDIPENGYGAWYEVQMRYASTFSMTLTPESDDVKAATDTTQSQTGGVNIVDLHYANVAGAKIWRMINTHSSYTDPAKVTEVTFRKPPTKTAYAAGEALDMTGAEIVADYEDGTHTIISLDAVGLTLSPANGATLAAGTTEVTATFSEHTATTPITVE